MSKVKIESEDCHCENCLMAAGMQEMVRLGQLSGRYKAGEVTSDEMALAMCIGVLCQMIVALHLMPDDIFEAIFEGVDRTYDTNRQMAALANSNPKGSC